MLSIHWSKYSLMSLFEILLTWVKYVQYLVNIVFESMGVDIESTERFEVFQHFLHAFSNYKTEFMATVQFEKVGVLVLSRFESGHVSF